MKPKSVNCRTSLNDVVREFILEAKPLGSRAKMNVKTGCLSPVRKIILEQIEEENEDNQQSMALPSRF